MVVFFFQNLRGLYVLKANDYSNTNVRTNSVHRHELNPLVFWNRSLSKILVVERNTISKKSTNRFCVRCTILRSHCKSIAERHISAFQSIKLIVNRNRLNVCDIILFLP